VRNFTARRHLKEMKKGEKFFFYHTGDEKQVVGIGEVIREPIPIRPPKKGEPWVAVTTASGRAAAEAGDARGRQGGAEAEDMALVKYPPVGAAGDGGAEWKLVCKMGGVKIRRDQLSRRGRCRRRRLARQRRLVHELGQPIYVAALGKTPEQFHADAQ
jgi:hypothetical protein